MRAAWYEQNGPAEVMQVGEMPDPEPGVGEVRVRVAASGINPSDWKRRQGLTRPLEFPRVIPHQDGSGVVDMIGAGVSPARLGERVWLYECQIGHPFGCAADYTVQPSHRAVPLPEGTTFAQGACLGVPAMTAHRCLFADGPLEGKTVLVTGGAGAVGNYAVQMARLAGATVLATVSGDYKAQIALDSGAHRVTNYRQEDVAEQVMEFTGGQGVDHIVEVDLGGNFEVSRRVLRSNGVLAVYSAGSSPQPAVPLQFRSTNVTLRMVLVYDMPESAKEEAVVDITQWTAQGWLAHLEGPHFPLESIKDAHRAVEGGAIGNVILDVSHL